MSIKDWISDLYIRIEDVLWNSDTRFMRWFISWMSLIAAIIFIFPGDSFSRPTFTLMKGFFPEEVWAAFFAINGISTMYSLLYKERVNVILFILDPVLGCIVWNLTAICMLLATFPAVFIPGEYCASITSWWILIRYPTRIRSLKWK